MADDNDDEKPNHVVIEMSNLGASKSLHQKHSEDVSWTPSTLPSRQQLDEEFDQEMLRRAIADTGRWAYGTISVEARILDERTGQLVRPKRAFWFDPIVVRESADNEAMMRLVDDTREDFVRPDALAPGVGLAGALWAELSHTRGLNLNDTLVPDILMPKRVVWREVEPISNDPDQPNNLWLQLAARAGIGLAAGVKYQFRGTQGLVVYMARASTDTTKLKSETNEKYLLSAADVIGSIVSLRGPRRVCLAERRADREGVRRRLRLKMVAFIRIGGSFLREGTEKRRELDSNTPILHSTTSSDRADQLLDNASIRSSIIGETTTRPRQSSIGKFIKDKLIRMTTKWRGANNEPPPPFSTTESIWTFFGCFLTLLMLLSFSEAIYGRNPEYSLVTGPFGALMTLQYSLTAAPASQPRNAILGQAISLSIALGLMYTPLQKNMRQALGTSLAIMCMARLGVTHPPAGAAAMIFAGGGYSWVDMGIMLAGNVLAILSATLINDMNIKRQYPTSWGFGYWHKYFSSSDENATKKDA